jgi:hypothetical protein
MAPPLVDIAKTYIDASVTDSEDTDAKHSVRILALCMQAIAKRNTTEWAGKVDLGVWTKKGLARWAWSHEFLAGLVALAQTRSVFAIYFFFCLLAVS